MPFCPCNECDGADVSASTRYRHRKRPKARRFLTQTLAQWEAAKGPVHDPHPSKKRRRNETEPVPERSNIPEGQENLPDVGRESSPVHQMVENEELNQIALDKNGSDTDGPHTAREPSGGPRADNGALEGGHGDNSTQGDDDTEGDKGANEPDDIEGDDDENEPDEGCLDELEREDREDELNLPAARPPTPPPPPPPPPPQNSDDAAPALSAINSIRLTQEYIALIKDAKLENTNLDPAILAQLRNPQEQPVDISDPDVRLSLDIFLAITNASEDVYNSVRRAVMRRLPESTMLSYYAVKKLVSEISGVVSVANDMCINSCHAFTGPLAQRDTCSVCGEARYDQEQLRLHNKKVPRQQFHTILLGPQLQALRRSPEGSQAMSYRNAKSNEVKNMVSGIQDAANMVYDDIFCGSDLVNLSEMSQLTADDVVVSGSLDGAQLYQNKASDMWIFIWIIEDLAPGIRYKKKHVLPGVFIPGPSKPKNIDSFTFCGLQHVSALQRENDGRGLRVWDYQKAAIIFSRPVFAFATADAVGIPEIDGRVGHHGAHSCRLGCPMLGRHKPATGHYHTAHLRPNDAEVGSNHPDTDIRNLPTADIATYTRDLSIVIQSRDTPTFEHNRKMTGISKPTLISGLDPRLCLPPPRCFVLDLMHLLQLNIPELLLSLWRGSIRCEPTDSKANWPWVKLTGATWKTHGKEIAKATKYFPSSFHRPPRNPAEKINSGYKATEWYLYVFGLGPGHFRAVLPAVYWRHFCKLVQGARIILQRSITGAQLREAHRLLVEFVEEYEELYYQRRMDRLHFCRPCIHTLLHTAPEVVRVGPGCYYTQFTIERTIGDLGQEVKQPSNPFANLSNRGIRRAQVNALMSICPELNILPPPNEVTSQDVGGGYILRHARDRTPRRLLGAEAQVIFTSLGQARVTRWARLRLPNGQTARSEWREREKPENKLRVSRMVQLTFNNEVRYAEIRFFLLHCAEDGDKPTAYAVASLFSPPDPTMLRESFGVLRACTYLGNNSLHVLPVTSIRSVVSMQPLPPCPDDPNDLWFAVDKPGLDDSEFRVYPIPN